MGDLTYVLLIIVITIIPQILVRNTYNRYAKVKVNSLQTGADIVKEMLDANGVDGVSIGQISGELTDHYNSKTKRINLSNSKKCEEQADLYVNSKGYGKYLISALKKILNIHFITKTSPFGLVFANKYISIVLYFTQ